MTCDLLIEITQSLIALVVVVGGGIAALTGSVHTGEIMPYVALIFGWYFGRTFEKKKPNGATPDPTVQ